MEEEKQAEISSEILSDTGILSQFSLQYAVKGRPEEKTKHAFAESFQKTARSSSSSEIPIKSPRLRCYTASAVLVSTNQNKPSRRSRHISASSALTNNKKDVNLTSLHIPSNSFDGRSSSVFSSSYGSDDDFGAYVSPLAPERRQSLQDGWHDFRIRDLSLASIGEQEIELTKEKMPALEMLKHRLSANEKLPLEGTRILLCVHIDAQAAVMILSMLELGAEVRVAACNFHSTQDEIAAALATRRIPTFGWAGMTDDEFWSCLDLSTSVFVKEKACHWHPNFLLDDGGDASQRLFNNHGSLFDTLKGIIEETQEGAKCLYNFKFKGYLNFPCLNTSLSILSTQFQNWILPELTLVNSLRRCMDDSLVGKKVLVVGCGRVGKSCVKALKKEQLSVSICEIDPICALQAQLAGVDVVGLDKVGDFDIIITATGCPRIIKKEHLAKMKNHAVLANMGNNTDSEIDIHDIKSDPNMIWQQIRTYPTRIHNIIITSEKKVCLISEGSVLTSVVPPPSIMNSVISCTRIMSIYELFKKKDKYQNDVYLLPRRTEEFIAKLHVESYGGELTTLTPELAKSTGKSVKGPFKENNYAY